MLRNTSQALVAGQAPTTSAPAGDPATKWRLNYASRQRSGAHPHTIGLKPNRTGEMITSILTCDKGTLGPLPYVTLRRCQDISYGVGVDVTTTAGVPGVPEAGGVGVSAQLV